VAPLSQGIDSTVVAMLFVVMFVVIIMMLTFTIVVAVVMMFAFAIVVAIVMMFTFAIVAAIVMVLTITIVAAIVMMLVAPVLPSNVTGFVFRGPHEVYGAVTCMIFAAVPAPVSRVVGWHMQVNRLEADFLRRAFNDHGLRVYQCWRRPITQVDAPIDTGRHFTGNRYCNAQVSGTRKGRYDAEPESCEDCVTNGIYHWRAPEFPGSMTECSMHRTNGLELRLLRSVNCFAVEEHITKWPWRRAWIHSTQTVLAIQYLSIAELRNSTATKDCDAFVSSATPYWQLGSAALNRA
jgi:hypothetical protein